MNKKKLIALAIVAILILLPFRMAFINFTIETEFLQVIAMTVVVLGSVVAVLMYNQGAEESEHH
ncbi:MAG TPA: hypothetical protein PK649_07475 [Vicingus sp.]|nr:hypothetical protein [Flavobacteriales bacterium]MCL4856822.1 hypothetical protein [Flavobacteriales bacterium]HRN41900.1 hypothetical protein [Vicingus sp.]HRP59242.1 hypothetical protein [Vicingus sp.]